MRVLLLSGVERRVTDPGLSAEVTDGGARFGLADFVHDLLLGKFRPLMGLLLSYGTAEAVSLLQFQPAVVFR